MPLTRSLPTHQNRSTTSQLAWSQRSHGSSLPLPSLSEVPKPSPKPPSLHHDYKGDVKAQDLIIEGIEEHRQKREKHVILYPGSDQFEMERMDVVGP